MSGWIPSRPRAYRRPADDTGNRRGRTRWVLVAATTLAMPKCLLCVAGYWTVATGTWAGLELCGRAANGTSWALTETVATPAAALAGALCLLALTPRLRPRGKAPDRVWPR
jgi:hypothetical protein